MSDWGIFQGTNQPDPDRITALPPPPSWRPAGTSALPLAKHRGATFHASADAIASVNAALYLRRPLLVTGLPGTGKSSLAYAVAYELGLGEVLVWSITTRAQLKDGLYRYDAIARLQDKQQDNLSNIGDYLQLGPLGTALVPSDRPRILLIDEIDKGDIDLPNDLLCVFEEGGFAIPELERIQAKLPPAEQTSGVSVKTYYAPKADDPQRTDRDATTRIKNGRVQCTAFPMIVMTSNGERDFPAPFLRRCVRLTMAEPSEDDLRTIVEAHLGELTTEAETLIATFLDKRQAKDRGSLATDQLLNAIYLVTQGNVPDGKTREEMIDQILKPLNSAEDA